MLVVTPVRLAPVGRGRGPLPPATAGAVVDGVGVVEGSAGPQPGQEPVEGLLEGSSPPCTVEGFDPGPRPPIEVCEGGVDLRLPMMIAPRRAEPPVRPLVVSVVNHGLDGMAGAGGTLLV